MKKFLLGLVLLTAHSCFSQTDKGVFVNPATIDFNLGAGQSGNAEITLINKLNKKTQFNIYLSDWARDTIGKHMYVPAGSLPRSCANWITLDKKFIEMEPNTVTKINLRLALPDSADVAKQMKWAMIFIETVQERQAPGVGAKMTAAITTNYRVGVHVYQTPVVVKNKDLQMLSFEAQPNSNDSVYRVVCQNTGDIQFRCKGFMELQNLDDGKKYKLEVNEFPLFPEQKRFVDFTIPATIPKGKYSVMAALDAGADMPLEAAQKTIVIK